MNHKDDVPLDLLHQAITGANLTAITSLGAIYGLDPNSEEYFAQLVGIASDIVYNFKKGGELYYDVRTDSFKHPAPDPAAEAR